MHRVLDFIDGDADRFIKPDQRAYLSVEAFGPPPPPPPPDAVETLKTYREVCRSFSEQGARFLFAKIAIRFGQAELERLENIAGSRHLASQVQKFVYMIPYFFVQGKLFLMQVRRP
jgi:hypothetical protein